MSESDNFRNGVEIHITNPWWYGLIFASIMPICLILASITDPNFSESEEIVLIITITIITSLVILTISFLSKNVIRRFAIDGPTQSLVYGEFWGGLRMVKRSYPLSTIDKFDLLLKNMPKSRHGYQTVEILALVFQPGSYKRLTTIHDRTEIRSWVIQLNSLLQDQAGFPAERFALDYTPHWPNQNGKKPQINQKKFLIVIGITTVALFAFLFISLSLL